jgi:hypothetical protein
MARWLTNRALCPRACDWVGRVVIPARNPANEMPGAYPGDEPVTEIVQRVIDCLRADGWTVDEPDVPPAPAAPIPDDEVEQHLAAIAQRGHAADRQHHPA